MFIVQELASGCLPNSNSALRRAFDKTVLRIAVQNALRVEYADVFERATFDEVVTDMNVCTFILCIFIFIV